MAITLNASSITLNNSSTIVSPSSLHAVGCTIFSYYFGGATVVAGSTFAGTSFFQVNANFSGSGQFDGNTGSVRTRSDTTPPYAVLYLNGVTTYGNHVAGSPLPAAGIGNLLQLSGTYRAMSHISAPNLNGDPPTRSGFRYMATRIA